MTDLYPVMRPASDARRVRAQIANTTGSSHTCLSVSLRSGPRIERCATDTTNNATFNKVGISSNRRASSAFSCAEGHNSHSELGTACPRTRDSSYGKTSKEIKEDPVGNSNSRMSASAHLAEMACLEGKRHGRHQHQQPSAKRLPARITRSC